MQFKFYKWVLSFLSASKIKKVRDFIKHYIGGIWHRIDEHHLFLSGGGIAFSLLLSVIPLFLLVFSVFGSIIEFATIERQISNLIDTIIPYPEYAAYTQKVIMTRLPGVIQYKTLAGYVGAFGLFFTSSWLFSSMRTILNRIFNVTIQKNALVAMLRDFGMVLLLVVFIAFSTFIFPILNFMVEAADEIEFFRAFQLTSLLDILFSVISILVIFLMFFIFYYLIPYEKLGKKVPLISAFWATVLWEVARNLFGYYVSEFLSVGNIYGAFILFIVVLFWIFYSSCLFIVGAEIGQLYREKWKINWPIKNTDTIT